MTDEPKPDAVPRRKRSAGTAGVRRHAERKKRAEESLIEVADLIDTMRGNIEDAAGSDDLVSIVRRDAPRMAETLASAAERFSPVASAVDYLFGAGGPLSAMMAFGPFLRRLVANAVEVRRQQQAEMLEHLDGQDFVYPGPGEFPGHVEDSFGG